MAFDDQELVFTGGSLRELEKSKD